ncbi:hypothetical protein Taro_002395 [Colocasia esculenta]|uniref:t-SNARE coiled-coil homology domain-containing protein n=1 Tax=Colocasia esculenta TaxID=4460 RepID=A0A843TJ28_COLES|nr:hypothetical protein [Colocasia esculenta]
MDNFQSLRAKISAEYVETVRRRYHTMTGEQLDEQMVERLILMRQSEMVFLDMAALVEAQGQQLNDIDCNISHASSFVHWGTEQLEVAREYQKSSRKCTCIAIALGAGIILFLVLPILSSIAQY